MATQQAIRRGILQSFDATSYTATVLIVEATNYVLSSVPIAFNVDGTSAISGASCAVLFFDESNHGDAVIIAIYGQPIPSPTPGRVVFSAPEIEVNGITINNGVTNTYTMGSNIPSGALGVIFKAIYTCTVAGAWINIAPHGGTIGNYATIGNLPAANAYLNGGGIVPLGSGNQLDVQSNGGNCNVTLYSYGYVI